MPESESQIKYKADIDKIIEVILHLAHRLAHQGIECSRYKIVKLVYLADVAHLNRYHRLITYDLMVAMENGPVPSATYNILKKNRRYGINYDELPFDFIQRGTRHYIENPKREIKRKLFSKSDLKILNETVEKYGNWTFGQLYDLTHEHQGYERAWKSKGSKGSNPIHYEDLIEESEEKADLVEKMIITCRHVL